LHRFGDGLFLHAIASQFLVTRSFNFDAKADLTYFWPAPTNPGAPNSIYVAISTGEQFEYSGNLLVTEGKKKVTFFFLSAV
jgi:hypothetical protein